MPVGATATKGVLGEARPAGHRERRGTSLIGFFLKRDRIKMASKNMVFFDFDPSARRGPHRNPPPEMRQLVFELAL